MSKTIRKIPWAVTGLAAVALAAFLAIGLLATNGVQQAEAQSAICMKVTESAPDTTDECEVTSGEAVITFQGGDNARNKFTFYVYGKSVTGDPVVFPPGTKYNVDDDQFKDAGGHDVEPIREQSVEVDKGSVRGGATKTLTISGEPLSSTTLYVYRAGFSPEAELIDNAPEGAAIKNALSTSDVLKLTVKFLGPPVKTVPDDDNTDADDLPDVVSKLTAAPSNIPNDATKITVTAQIQDANQADLEGEITYTVTFKDGSKLLPGFRYTYTAPSAKFPSTSNAAHTVRGWKASGEVVVDVSATFTGDTGSITLQLDSLKRAGPLNSVDVSETCFIAAEADDVTPAQEKACGTDKDNAKHQKPRTVFVAGQSFAINAKALDALETDTEVLPTVVFPKDAKTSDDEAVFTGNIGAVEIHADAPAGRYQLKVKATQGTGSDKIDKEATVEIIVAGVPANYAVTGPQTIALDAFSSGEFTIKATDANGNPPAFDVDKTENKVAVAVESTLGVIKVTGLTDDTATLSADTGEATFTIYKPSAAQEGDTVQIGIFVNDELKSQTTVTFGTASALVLGDASDLMAVAGTAAGTVKLTWAPGANATRHFVAGVKKSDQDAGTPADSLIWTSATNSDSHTVPDLHSGEEYLFVVIAGDADGWGNWTPAQMATPS